MVCRLAKVAPTTLDYWIKVGLVSPSLVPGAGKRFSRYWTIDDLVIVRAVKALREAGCPLQKVRQARLLVREMTSAGDGTTVLYWDGADVLAVEPWGDVYSAINEPGQQVLHLLALPVLSWREEASRTAVTVDLEVLRRRRVARRRPVTETQRISVRRTRNGA
jgi:DNA-binding transcriptional MerR regulator